MSRTIDGVTAWPLRTLPKDLGVAAVVLVALLAGLILRWSAEGRTREFSSVDQGFSMAYPATWRTNTVTNTQLLRIENPQAGSAYKTNVTVESRELDPSAPPTIQELIDRRVVQHSVLTGYHFLSSSETTVAGARAAQIDFAFVSQPIDTPRSASLPVVVQSREYLLIAKNRVYYITLSAPESDFSRANDQFDTMLRSVKIE
jgi:hypothetical protein